MKTKQAEMPLEAEAVESTELAAPISATPATYSAGDPNEIIRMVLSASPSIEVAERAFALSEKMRERAAKCAFDDAMADFQSRCPIIKKLKKAPHYSYAPLDAIVSQTKDLLKECGFSYAINTETRDGKLFAVCVAKHRAGHSETSSFPCTPISGTSAMSEIQKVSASVTFAKRQCYVNAFGIMTGDEDTDGYGGGKADAPAHDAAALKRELIALTKQVHGCPSKLTDDGMTALTDWLRENKFMTSAETLGGLSADRIKNVVDGIKRMPK